MSNVILLAADEIEMRAVGKKIASALEAPFVIYFLGELGAGKTTLVSGVLRAYGHTGAVKSPTYTLVEPYELDPLQVYHFDLYRLGDPEELEYIGIREYNTENALCFFEWPDKGKGYIPHADMVVKIDVLSDGVRRISCSGFTPKAAQLIAALIK